MALKRKLTKAEHDALPEVLKAEYKASGDHFLLDADDAAELTRALDRERSEKGTIQTQLTALQTELQTLKDGTARSSGDIVTLEKSWQKKLKDEQDLSKVKVDKLHAILRKSLIEDRALALATELAGDNAEVLLPHIKTRLSADLDSEVPTTRVLDSAGQLSAFTVDDLKKEFLANKKFSAIIIASKASGSATGRTSGTTAVPQGKKFEELSEGERVAWHKSDPAAFATASKEFQETQRQARG